MIAATIVRLNITLDDVKPASSDKTRARCPEFTTRTLYLAVSTAGTRPVMAGTPTEIADEMEAWHVAGPADGFNPMFPLLPDDWLRFAEFVVPKLQRRGLTRREYASGTLRDRLGLRRPANRFDSA
jgi:alkanesulfonate monooxygenase SsuD/methylene tetrahydromethanopterin reductase-like flavin-dependent oxidoreductase (luciferase family)